METISIKELEKHILEKEETEEQYFSYITNLNKSIEFDYEVTEKSTKEELYDFSESIVIDYIEEICNYDADSIEDAKDKLVVSNLKEVLSISLNYVKEGISYMDLVQEGTLGLIEAVEKHPNEKDFLKYRDFWIVRAIVKFINSKFVDIKYEFKQFFKEKRDTLLEKHEHNHNHEQHTHSSSCSCSEENHTHSHSSGSDCSCESDDKNLEEEIFKNEITINKIESELDNIIDFDTMKNRLSTLEIKVLKYYFGFEEQKRHSIYEIENKFSLYSGEGEEIFKDSILKLSTVRGKVLI